MFHITKQALGNRGSFVKLVKSDSDDYVVIVRLPADARLHHRYIGPDLAKADEVFDTEVAKLEAPSERDEQ